MNMKTKFQEYDKIIERISNLNIIFAIISTN